MFDIHNFGFSAEGSFEVEGELCTSAAAFASLLYLIGSVCVCWRGGAPLSLDGNFESQGKKRGADTKANSITLIKREVNLKLSRHARFKGQPLSHRPVSGHTHTHVFYNKKLQIIFVCFVSLCLPG